MSELLKKWPQGLLLLIAGLIGVSVFTDYSVSNIVYWMMAAALMGGAVYGATVAFGYVPAAVGLTGFVVFCMLADFVVVYDLILFISTFVFGFIGTGITYFTLKRFGVLSAPNARSNHAEPVVVGGGLGAMFAILCFLMIVSAPWAIILSVAVLTGLSFYDDIRPLSPRIRLGVQALCVLVTMVNVYNGHIFDGFFPQWAEVILLSMVWIWFINLFNFMDGSDGLAATEAICISLGLFVLSFSVNLSSEAFLYSMIIAGSMLGFVLWNWAPAKLFMGDAGSIPLGFLMGFMLITMAGDGHWAAALILPAYFVADATSTLISRALRKEKLLQAHSEHAYQQAIRSGMPHNEVAKQVAALNLALLLFAVLSTLGLYWSLLSLFFAYGFAAMLMARFRKGEGAVTLAA